MSAIDIAFELLKRYTPNWRDEVRDIAPLEEYEVPFVPQEEESWDTQVREGYVGSGSKAHVFEHPWRNGLVVKVPHDNDYSREGFHNRIEEGEHETLQFLEELGYPLAPEMPMGQGDWTHSIQPKLDLNINTDFNHENRWRGRTHQHLGAADRALAHMIRDRHKGNYGVDAAGNIRNFDLDSIGPGGDFFPNETEKYQTEYLDPLKIQHPTSKVLDFFDDRETGRFNDFKELMRILEPYSDNPDTLTVDGKPIWLEGYE